MRKPVSGLVALMLVLAMAAFTAGCGGDDDDGETTAAESGSEAAALQEEIADLSDEEQIRRVGAAWAEPFSAGDEVMCEYLHPDVAPSCNAYLDSALTGSTAVQASFSGATVEDVKVNGDTAVARFSNERRSVGFAKDPDDAWRVVDVIEREGDF